ncbi:hypothetical protein OROMI_028997 [Orobanche minor]
MATGWDTEYTYRPRPLFEHTFVCLPFSKYKSPHFQTGNKIIMPPSSLSKIISLPIKYPLIFRIETYDSDKTSHCGVLEFEAGEGCVHMPDLVMRNLKIREGDLVILRDAALPKACFMKLQPHTTAFCEVSDPKGVLERTLRDFTCVSRGDTIVAGDGGREFYLDVLEVSPGDAVSLVDTDCRVEFAPPLDYRERGRSTGGGDGRGEESGEGRAFVSFGGKGRRIDGNAVEDTVVGVGGCSAALVEDMSKLVVDREGKKKREKDGGREEAGGEKFKAITGRSRVLGGIEV